VNVVRRFALAAIPVLSLLLAVASASGAPALVTSSYQLASRQALALSGPATLVAGFDGDEANVVRSFTPGSAPVVVARVALKAPGGATDGGTVIYASTSRLALFDEEVVSTGYKGCCGTYARSLESGLLGGPLHELTAGCQLAPGLDESVGPELNVHPTSALALDGEVLAYDSFGCLVIEDFASPLQRIVPLQATLDPVYGSRLHNLSPNSLLSVAGRLVAYRANPSGGEGQAAVVVYDIDTGSELFRVPLPPYQPYEPAPTFALQPDGTLVVADGNPCTATVSTMADPAPVNLGIPACEVAGLRDGRALIVTLGKRRNEALAWTPIETPFIHPIANLGKESELLKATPVMDETSVAYALGGCWSPRVYRTSLAEPGSPPAPPVTCPVIVSPRHATLTSQALRVRISCPLGCRGEFGASAGTARELRRESGGMSLVPARSATLSIAPGHSKTFSLEPGQEEKEYELKEISARIHTLKRRLQGKQRLELKLGFYIQTPRGGWPSEHDELGAATRPHVMVPIQLQ
jgi:hypothetical protein